MATVNIKIAGKTYEGVEVLEVESADGDGVWLRFLPDTTAKTYDISYALSGCTVDDTERTISEGGSKTIRVTPEEGRALANDGDLVPVVSGATLVSYVADGDLDYILTISNPTANVAITLNAGYVFSVNVTDCTESPVGKRYFVSDSDKVTLSFMTGEGFAFDDSAVSATGMEFIMSVGMDHKTLAVTVSNPDTGSSERMLIVHASTQRTISYVTTGCTSDSSNPQYAPYYGTLDLWFTSSDGYYFPTAGTAVSGTSSWLAYTHDTQPDGTEVPVGKVLVRLNDLSQDTSDIVVTVTATRGDTYLLNTSLTQPASSLLDVDLDVRGQFTTYDGAASFDRMIFVKAFDFESEQDVAENLEIINLDSLQQNHYYCDEVGTYAMSGDYMFAYSLEAFSKQLVEATTEYRTFTITGGDDATNADFIAWLEANATKLTQVQTLTVNGTAVEAVTVNDTTVDKILVSEV